MLVRNAPSDTDEAPVVQVKWYSEDIYYEEGVNVYRRVEGSLNWVKLNEGPILKKNNVSAQALADEPDLEFFTEVVNETPKAELLEGFVLINIIVKTFQSNLYADFLGIYYEDGTAESGVSYEYRVNKIEGGREFTIGTSDPLTAGQYVPSPPVKGFTVNQDKEAFMFDWEIEKDRFYAVNLYVTSSDSAGERKLNDNPLIISQVEDSLGNIAYPSPKFQWQNLKEGVTYTYSISGLGFFEDETARSDEITLSLNDVTPPPPPVNLQGRADSMKVHLEWDISEAPDIKEFRLYRSPYSDGPFEVVYTTVNSTSYLDTLHIPGPYYYYIASVDHSNNEGLSRKIFLEAQDVFPPGAPEGLTVTADTGRLKLSWERNKEADLAGYLVYRTIDKNNHKNYVLVTPEPIQEHTFEQKLPKNVKNRFFYQVVAVDTSYNRSRPSVYAAAKMPDVHPPERPHIKNISYDNENIVIEWVANADPDLMGYKVLRSDSVADLNFVQVNQDVLSPVVTRYADRSNDANQGYLYRVIALDSAGNASEPSLGSYAIRVSDTDVEGQLSFKLKHYKRKSENKITWDEATEDSEIMGYVIYRGKSENDINPLTGLLKSTETEFIDKDLQEEELYYQVRAYHKAGSVIKSEIKQWKSE